MSQRKSIYLLLLSLMIPVAAAAYSVSGTVVDENHDPLIEASVRLLAGNDSTYVKGVAADIDGKFTLSGISSGNYIIETTYVGYSPGYTDISVGKSNLKLDPIVLTEASHMLAEATVVGRRAAIKVLQDTIEYNADSYKTQPNSVVEDLLKRLPGVEVDSDGKITANGREVTKILVDGKEFFSDDPKVASKNLPVSMVERLQVIDRKSDLARMTGVDDGEEETVINLSVRKNMTNGWFGAAEAGYGTDDRYQATFNISRFWNGNQLTFIGNANNTNDLGFTDGNGSRFRRFGGDQGITESQSIGVNFNVGNEEILRVGGNVMYSHSDKHSVQRQNRQYLLQTDSYDQHSLTDSRDKGHNFDAEFRIEWKPDSFNTIDVRPFFTYNENDSRSEAFSVAVGKNMSLNRNFSDGTSYEAGARLIYNHNFNSRRGRSFSVFANYRMSNVREDDDSYVYNLFQQLNDSVDVYDQYTDNHTWSNSLNTRLTWTEPIGNVKNGNFLTIGYGINYRWNNADKLVYDRPVTLGDSFWDFVLNNETYRVPAGTVDYTSATLNDTLSNRFRNTNFQQDIRLGYKKVNRLYNLDAGLSLVPIISKSVNLINSAKNIPSRTVWNVAPFLRFRYKFSQSSSVSVDYHGRSSQPTMSQLQPVADYSNPLNIVVGNPELVPTFSHNIRLRQQHFDAQHQQSVMTMFDATFERNSIISKTIYDMTTGGRTTTYENVNGVWNARLMNMFSRPLGSHGWSFMNNIFSNLQRNVGYNNGERNKSTSIGIAESFSFAYRPDNMEFELRPNYYFQHTSNSASSVESTTIHRFGGTFNGTYYAPYGFVLATDLTYSANRGYASGFDADSWMWNASISYQFLPGKAATIMLKAYDLLQQKKDINRTVTASYIDDTQYNALTRYFMITFTYKFNTFGAGNQPESRNERRGPDGPPPGGSRRR